MTDNFQHIKSLLKFESPDDFYFIQIIQRRKDNPGLDKPEKVIKEYYVDNADYLDKKRESIIESCEKYNARATIRLNKRSYKKCALKMLLEVAQRIDGEQYRSVKSGYSSVAGRYPADPEKKWLLDIDKGDIDFGDPFAMENLRQDLYQYNPVGEKQIALIKSKTGYHMIVRPFDMREFNKKYPTIEIHKDNPVNLYIP